MRKKLKSKNVNNFNLSIISVCFCSQQGDNHHHPQQVYLIDKPNEMVTFSNKYLRSVVLNRGANFSEFDILSIVSKGAANFSVMKEGCRDLKRLRNTDLDNL
jgi:hypothetical protein